MERSTIASVLKERGTTLDSEWDGGRERGDRVHDRAVRLLPAGEGVAGSARSRVRRGQPRQGPRRALRPRGADGPDDLPPNRRRDPGDRRVSGAARGRSRRRAGGPTGGLTGRAGG